MIDNIEDSHEEESSEDLDELKEEVRLTNGELIEIVLNQGKMFVNIFRTIRF